MFDDYPPLELQKEVETRIPRGFQMMKDIHCANGEEDVGSWPEWCYAPLDAAACVALFEGDVECEDIEKMLDLASPLAEKLFAVAPWVEQKKVYVLDPALEEYVLKNRVILARIPSMDLVHMPCASFYIQVNSLGTDGYPLHGAFVTLNYDQETEAKECRILFLYSNYTWESCAVTMGERSVFGAIQDVLDTIGAEDDCRREGSESLEFEEAYRRWKKQMEGTLQLVFFLCLMEYYKEDGALTAVTRFSPVGEMDISYVSKPEDPTLCCMKAFAC